MNATHHQTDNPDLKHITDENNNLEKLPVTNLASLDKEYPEVGPKAILIPPTPLKVTTDEEADQNSHEWTLVTMEYRNFAFIRRLGFLFFQVSRLKCLWL
ncbi:hypothetical protein EON65_07740 [archaeon]|nr:MAG: hypothetical protein EON65_07740 [archaeon]